MNEKEMHSMKRMNADTLTSMLHSFTANCVEEIVLRKTKINCMIFNCARKMSKERQKLHSKGRMIFRT